MAPIPITRAEYEAKFGVPARASTPAPTPIPITRAEYAAKFGGSKIAEPSVGSEFLSGAWEGVKDTPSSLVQALKSIPAGVSNVYSSITSPIDSAKDGTLEKTIRGTGTVASGLAGAGAGAAVGAPLAPFTLGLSVPIGATLGGALGILGFNKANQATGVDEPTTLKEDAHSLGYNTGQGLTGTAATKVASTVAKAPLKLARAVTNNADDLAANLDRKSIGARYEDYKKTSNDLGTVELPDGELQTLTQTALDDLIQKGKLGQSRNPSELLDTARKATRQISTEIDTIIKDFDENVGAPVVPKFERALEFLESGKVPADKMDSYLGRLGDLQAKITREGKGKLAFLQQQKIAQGKQWDANDSVLNDFNRTIYADLQNTIESAAPAVKPLNLELQKFKVAEPILYRNMAQAASADWLDKAKSTIHTTGGFGVPVGIGYAATGPVGAAAGLAVGAGYNYLRSPSGRQALAKAIRKIPQVPNKITDPSIAALSAVPKAGPAAFAVSGDLAQKDQARATPSDTKQRQQEKEKTTKVPSSNYKPISYSREANFDRAQVAEIIRQQPPIIQAMALVESANKPKAVSKAGARGLMQVMPEHYERLGVTDPFDPIQNVRAGKIIYAEELQRFRDPKLALAAYNAGSPRVLKAIERAGSRSWEDIRPYLPRETQAYVAKVLYNEKKLQQQTMMRA